MIIYCPNCGQKCELDDEYDGAAVECPKCEKEFVARKPIPLIVCPACQEKVSSMAEACPHCGQPIAPPAPKPEPQPVVIQQAPPHYPVLQVNYIKKNAKYGTFAVLGFVAVFFLWVGGCDLTNTTGMSITAAQQEARETAAQIMRFVSIVPFIAAVIFCSFYSERAVHCERCGYSGFQTARGGANIIVFLLLLCFAILPGLIYLAICSQARRKFKCPNCGLEKEA